MSALSRFIRKWIAFFFPVKGWQKRYKLFKAGNTTWEVPGKPEADKVCPFPVEWIPHSVNAADLKTEADQKRGFVFLAATCIECGKEAEIGRGVLCLRCGVPLHDTEEANMFSGFDPPYCRRCAKVIRLAV